MARKVYSRVNARVWRERERARGKGGGEGEGEREKRELDRGSEGARERGSETMGYDVRSYPAHKFDIPAGPPLLRGESKQLKPRKPCTEDAMLAMFDDVWPDGVADGVADGGGGGISQWRHIGTELRLRCTLAPMKKQADREEAGN